MATLLKVVMSFGLGPGCSLLSVPLPAVSLLVRLSVCLSVCLCRPLPHPMICLVNVFMCFCLRVIYVHKRENSADLSGFSFMVLDRRSIQRLISVKEISSDGEMVTCILLLKAAYKCGKNFCAFASGFAPVLTA